jgi:hypothetical protein
MMWRFRRMKTLLPGVRLNVGKHGPSVRLGPRGLGYTIGTTGRRVTASLPGTGLSVTHKFEARRAADHAPVLDAISLLVFIMLVAALIAWLFR